jgi:hypothetical protein
MGSTFRHILAAKLVGFVLTVAGGPPKFNVAPSCKAASAIDQSMDLAVSQDYQSCMKDEEGARQELVQKWSKFKPEDRTRCIGQAGAGGMPSYVEALECLLVTVSVGNPQ